MKRTRIGRDFSIWILMVLALMAPANGQVPSFDGEWRSTWGPMELEQTDNRVEGSYGVLKLATKITGRVEGTRFSFTWTGRGNGEGWFELAADGKTFSGKARQAGQEREFEWGAYRSDVHQPTLIPGQIVDGLAESDVTYHIRAPNAYDCESAMPAILILHGSNMSSKAYVETIVHAWPKISERYILIGINGEKWNLASPPDAPVYNYSYVNFMGRSTYGGYPGTDRESPALVAEAVEEIKGFVPISKLFVGGHSQGGFLTPALFMNYPELFDGAFPISAGLLMQCEPTAFDDQQLRKQQRSIPIAIVHGQNDPAVPFSMGQSTHESFMDNGFPALRFVTDARAGHMFALLPVDDAIDWLEWITSDDVDRLKDFAQDKMAEGANRDAIAALRRAEGLDGIEDRQRERTAELLGEIDKLASEASVSLDQLISTNRDGSWIDEFLEFREEFEFAHCAGEVMIAYQRLRKQHEGEAQKLFIDARNASRNGNDEQAFDAYQQIVSEYYASTLYRLAKRQLDERK